MVSRSSVSSISPRCIRSVASTNSRSMVIASLTCGSCSVKDSLFWISLSCLAMRGGDEVASGREIPADGGVIFERISRGVRDGVSNDGFVSVPKDDIRGKGIEVKSGGVRGRDVDGSEGSGIKGGNAASKETEGGEGDCRGMFSSNEFSCEDCQFQVVLFRHSEIRGGDIT